MLVSQIASRLAQLDMRWSAAPEAASSNPGRTNAQGLSITEPESAVFQKAYAKRLDFLVFSDKDHKP